MNDVKYKFAAKLKKVILWFQFVSFFSISRKCLLEIESDQVCDLTNVAMHLCTEFGTDRWRRVDLYNEHPSKHPFIFIDIEIRRKIGQFFLNIQNAAAHNRTGHTYLYHCWMHLCIKWRSNRCRVWIYVYKNKNL